MKNFQYVAYLMFLVLCYPTLAAIGEKLPIPGRLIPKNTYKISNLPDFDSFQDYSARTYLPVVRLELMDGTFVCSGSVISDDYVLTAAHCLMQYDKFLPGMDTKIRIVARNTTPGRPGVVITATPAALNNRADYGLIVGDFKKITHLKIHTSVNLGEVLNGVAGLCGYPWGAELVCYITNAPFSKYNEHLITTGVLFPGMSGGPVFDGLTEEVFAVNKAVAGNAAIVAPLIGLWESFGIHVK